MKNQIVKAEIAKTAEYLQCTLISADFLKTKKVYKNKIISNGTIEFDDPFVITKSLS